MRGHMKWIILLSLLCMIKCEASKSRLIHLEITRKPPLSQRISYYEQKIDSIQLNKQITHTKQNSSKIQQNGIHEYRIQNVENNQYTVSVSLGSNQQKQQLLLDTGSSYSIVQAAICITPPCSEQVKNANPSLFNCSSSSTCFLKDPNTFTLKFPRGSATGYLVSDVACMDKDVCTNDQFEFIAVSKDEGAFKSLRSSGILGLGIEKAGEKRSLVAQLKASGMIDSKSFSVYLSEREGDKSFLTLGGFDSSKMTGEMRMHNLASENNWAVPLGSVKINGEEINLSGTKNILIDTGSSGMAVPRTAFNEILKLLGKTRKCRSDISDMFIECSCPNGDTSVFPTIIFVIGSEKSFGEYELTPKEYVESRDHVCLLKIGVYHSSDGMWVLGDIFLRKYLAYFQIENQMIGFAQSKTYLNDQTQLAKNFVLILECLVGSFFLALLIIYFIRIVSGLKNTKDEILTF